MCRYLIIFSLFLLSFNSYSECKWSSIQKTGETFVYDKDCHLEVGKLVTLAPLKDQEIFLLKDKNIKTEQIITLKDLEIKKLNEKSDLWETNSKDLNDKIQKIEKYNKVENWLYFGAGSLSVALAVYLASKLTK